MRLLHDRLVVEDAAVVSGYCTSTPATVSSNVKSPAVPILGKRGAGNNVRGESDQPRRRRMRRDVVPASCARADTPAASTRQKANPPACSGEIVRFHGSAKDTCCWGRTKPLILTERVADRDLNVPALGARLQERDGLGVALPRPQRLVMAPFFLPFLRAKLMVMASAAAVASSSSDALAISMPVMSLTMVW